MLAGDWKSRGATSDYVDGNTKNDYDSYKLIRTEAVNMTENQLNNVWRLLATSGLIEVHAEDDGECIDTVVLASG